MLENTFVREMRNAGIRVAIEAPQKDDRSKRAGITVSRTRSCDCPSPTTDISRPWWLFSKRVERSARADLFVQFIDLSTGDIALVKEIHKEYGDTIPYSKLKLVEDAQYDFTRPSRSEFKMARILEPLVVGGIVVGLVYLFFSNQSSN